MDVSWGEDNRYSHFLVDHVLSFSLSLSLSISLTLCLQRLSGLAFFNFIFVLSVRVGEDIYLTICSLHDIYYTLYYNQVYTNQAIPFLKKTISLSLLPPPTQKTKRLHTLVVTDKATLGSTLPTLRNIASPVLRRVIHSPRTEVP